MFRTKVVEEIKRRILYSITSFQKRAVYWIMWKKRNIVVPGRPQMTVWHMCIASWISVATDIHKEYVITIAFPLQ
jgi:hypothetical protein